MNETIEILRNIEKRLGIIENHLGIVKKDCSKMSGHIEFVENIYEILRKPLNYIMGRVPCQQKDQLPQLKEKLLEIKNNEVH
jgi:hypothetical protein